MYPEHSFLHHHVPLNGMGGFIRVNKAVCKGAVRGALAVALPNDIDGFVSAEDIGLDEVPPIFSISTGEIFRTLFNTKNTFTISKAKRIIPDRTHRIGDKAVKEKVPRYTTAYEPSKYPNSTSPLSQMLQQVYCKSCTLLYCN